MEETCMSRIRACGTRWELLALLTCVLAANVLFIRQAFHMDDGIYLLLAKNIGHSRWFPQHVPTHFEGLFFPDFASTEHPIPITSYYIALINNFDGAWNEVNLNAGFIVFPLI